MQDKILEDFDVSRETVITEIPVEWTENLKKGLCPVCAKPKSEFHKRMRVYCSRECKAKYYSKIFTWGELREKILNRDNHACKKCGLNEKSASEERKKEMAEKSYQVGLNHPAEVEKKRADLLEQVEELYAEAQDDKELIRQVGLRFLNWKSVPYVSFEVDHIVPICEGGEMWDESNLQTLCNKCHSKKTKIDLKNHRQVPALEKPVGFSAPIQSPLALNRESLKGKTER